MTAVEALAGPKSGEFDTRFVLCRWFIGMTSGSPAGVFTSGVRAATTVALQPKAWKAAQLPMSRANRCSGMACIYKS